MTRDQSSSHALRKDDQDRVATLFRSEWHQLVICFVRQLASLPCAWLKADFCGPLTTATDTARWRRSSTYILTAAINLFLPVAHAEHGPCKLCTVSVLTAKKSSTGSRKYERRSASQRTRGGPCVSRLHHPHRVAGTIIV